MNRITFILKVLGAIFLTYLVLVVLLTHEEQHPHQLVFVRFLTGFAYFISGNFPLISWNADQWVPGVGAFVIAWMIMHRWFSRWAKRTHRPWNLMTSFCVVALVPVLFVISFIVPGVLLQWEVLQEVNWTMEYSGI